VAQRAAEEREAARRQALDSSWDAVFDEVRHAYRIALDGLTSAAGVVQ